ncbi:hypothetical protein [Synechococcus sp. PCC 7502]|uniref:hypothetical protein n=1 Tax=Synechococcus sp. PCC 7502 TaxID=1173263 RepID=UPI0002DEAF61|nr:hypothetical protein [Synechococcus sp. PCC 7502]
MSVFVVFFAKAPAIVGILVILIFTSIAVFNGWKGYVELKGNPIMILTPSQMVVARLSDIVDTND